jgi:peroxiredoxin
MVHRIPDIDFILHGSPVPDEDGNLESPDHKSTSWYFEGKKVILFGLPGAFTPTCSNEMLPAYEEYFDKFKKVLDIDAIYCTSVNDDYVMEAWARDQKIKNVEMIPDGNGELADSLGMLVKKTNLGFGDRSWRYAAYVVDGVIVELYDEPGLCHNSPTDPYDISSPENVFRDLAKKMSPDYDEEI